MVTQTKSQEFDRAQFYILSHSPLINWQIHSILCFQANQNSITRPKFIERPVEAVLRLVQAVLVGLQNVSQFQILNLLENGRTRFWTLLSTLQI